MPLLRNAQGLVDVVAGVGKGAVSDIGSAGRSSGGLIGKMDAVASWITSPFKWAGNHVNNHPTSAKIIAAIGLGYGAVKFTQHEMHKNELPPLPESMMDVQAQAMANQQLLTTMNQSQLVADAMPNYNVGGSQASQHCGKGVSSLDAQPYMVAEQGR